MNPTVEVEVRRNRHGSVLAYADRDRAARLLEDHRAVLQSLYDLVDRRHGSDGEIVARLSIREDTRIVEDLNLRDRFRRDLKPNRAIALIEDLRYHAGERELVTDGGKAVTEQTGHQVSESIGEDSLGFEHVRCECGRVYPVSSGGCPERGRDE